MAGEKQEFITEWPPLEPNIELPSAKKPKISENEVTGTDNPEFSRELVECPPDIKAEPLLAKWWKKRRKNDGTSLLPPNMNSKNPKTILYHLSRTSQAVDFLQERIHFLSSLGSSCDSHAVNFSLATCYHMLKSGLGTNTAALRHASRALETATGDTREVEWLLELLKRQRAVEERKEEGMSVIEKWPSEKTLKMPQFAEVERREHSDLSCAEFYSNYVQEHKPVIITGIVDKMTSKPWTLEYMKKVIGHKKTPLKRVVPGSVEWAQLEETPGCEVREFIKSLDSQDRDLSYLFDWSLPLNCPELMAELTIPDYFAGDYLRKTPKGSLYHDSWPSLFIAPAAITSELHVDAFSSNFWMALFEGKKRSGALALLKQGFKHDVCWYRWVFFPPEDLPFLYPVYYHSTDAVFEVDLSRNDIPFHHPLLALTSPSECVLEPGELLFVPSGSPHRVQNLEKSLAISANFVDSSNIDAVKRELKVNGLLDPRAEELLNVLEGEEFSAKNNGTTDVG